MQEDQTSDIPTVTAPAAPSRKRIRFPKSWQGATLLLIIVVAVMAYMWKPWEPNIKASERTITVTGEATVSAVPDQFVFSPNYRFTAADKQTALKELTAKSDEIIKQLKSLGVANKDIKTNSSGYDDNGYYYYSSSAGNVTYTFTLTVTVNDAKLAQKVQDYLVTTNPIGTLSPYASFSKAKKRDLENQARDQAEKDARAKADRSAANLGFRVDAVKSVDDYDRGGIGPYNLMARGANAASGAEDSSSQLDVQPGQNDFTYSVRVVYYIR